MFLKCAMRHATPKKIKAIGRTPPIEDKATWVRYQQAEAGYAGGRYTLEGKRIPNSGPWEVGGGGEGGARERKQGKERKNTSQKPRMQPHQAASCQACKGAHSWGAE